MFDINLTFSIHINLVQSYGYMMIFILVYAESFKTIGI